LAIAISLGLQHGVPLDEFVDAFLFHALRAERPWCRATRTSR